VSIWRETFGHVITDEEAEALLSGKEIGPVVCKFKTGEREAILYFNKTERGVAVRYPEDPSTTEFVCPVCGYEVVEGDRLYHCVRYSDACCFAVWKRQFGHIITKEEAAKIISGGETDLIGLTFKNGRTSQGHLYFDQEKKSIRIHFPRKEA
jgi:hypothetical protein